MHSLTGRELYRPYIKRVEGRGNRIHTSPTRPDIQSRLAIASYLIPRAHYSELPSLQSQLGIRQANPALLLDINSSLRLRLQSEQCNHFGGNGSQQAIRHVFTQTLSRTGPEAPHVVAQLAAGHGLEAIRVVGVGVWAPERVGDVDGMRVYDYIDLETPRVSSSATPDGIGEGASRCWEQCIHR